MQTIRAESIALRHVIGVGNPYIPLPLPGPWPLDRSRKRKAKGSNQRWQFFFTGFLLPDCAASLRPCGFARIHSRENPSPRRSAPAYSLQVLASVLFSLGTFLAIFARSSAEAENLSDLPASIPPGETMLAEIGVQQVSWQSYGRPPVAMPGAWMGHFDPQSGISYQTWGRVLGRQALLMHSPWHVPPGKSVGRLPPGAAGKLSPIRLSFGIAMGPDVAVPGKSDGVTFSCFLLADGKRQELMRRHHAKAEWIDYAFDLSPYAGKTVVLRLQVEPGPRNDASFDYLVFRRRQDHRGQTAADHQRRRAGKAHRARAYRATAGCNLAALRATRQRRRDSLEPAAVHEPHGTERRGVAIHLRGRRLPPGLHLHPGDRHAG